MIGTLIDCHRLSQRLGQPGWVLVDCRFDLADTPAGALAYRQSHLPGAVYAHLDEVLSSPITPVSGRHPLPDPDRLRTWLGDHGIDNDTQVVAYDASGGNMAVRLWWLLRWLGHHRVCLLDGGWQAWLEAGLPVDDRQPDRPRRTFVGSPDPDMLLETRQIAAPMDKDPWLLIDARTAERFRGEQEPIDPVAGHIPGALNLPLGDHLDAEGRFKPADELRALYQPLVGDHPPGRIAAMCGSGVTACHTLLAMEIAGITGARLYAGSWSEWIRDPQRPVATGQ